MRQIMAVLPEPTMVIQSGQMKEVVQQLRKAAKFEFYPVLLTGESGVGKQEAADFLHVTSQALHGNQYAPFADINCSGLSSTLLESELFGHELGAFTGAVKEKVGLLEMGAGGSVFLDEIGDAGRKLQKRLLKFLDTGTFSRVGGTQKREVRTRIIAATNRDLRKDIGKGDFRADLYYRLNVFAINIPPLRERKDEIEPLVRNCIKRFNDTRMTHVHPSISKTVLTMLEQHEWPGNVRELFNAVERAIINSDGEDELVTDDFRLDEPIVFGPGDAPIVTIPPGGVALEQIERIAHVEALKMTNGHQQRAAALLKISSRVMNYNIKKHRIDASDGVNTENWHVHESEPVD